MSEEHLERSWPACGPRTRRCGRDAGRASSRQRQGRGLRLRAGAVPGDALQGAVAPAARHGGRDPRLHPRARKRAEDQGVKRAEPASAPAQKRTLNPRTGPCIVVSQRKRLRAGAARVVLAERLVSRQEAHSTVPDCHLYPKSPVMDHAKSEPTPKPPTSPANSRKTCSEKWTPSPGADDRVDPVLRLVDRRRAGSVEVELEERVAAAAVDVEREPRDALVSRVEEPVLRRRTR